MDDEQQPNNEGAPTGAQDEPQVDPHRERLLKDLAGQKAARRDAEAKLAEYQRKEQEAAAAQERAAGDFKSIEARLQAQIRNEAERAQAAEDKLARYETELRQGKVVEKLAEAGGIGNRKILSKMLDDIGMADADPEALSNGDVQRAIKALKQQAPELFGAATTNTTKPPPGGGQRPPDNNTAEHWKTVGKAFSQRSSNAAYFAARGSKQ